MNPDREDCPHTGNGDVESSIRSDRKLIAKGWTRRFLADPARANEAIQLYSSLGYEVKAQKLTPADFGPECGECPAVVCTSYVMIYTRKRKHKQPK